MAAKNSGGEDKGQRARVVDVPYPAESQFTKPTNYAEESKDVQEPWKFALHTDTPHMEKIDSIVWNQQGTCLALWSVNMVRILNILATTFEEFKARTLSIFESSWNPQGTHLALILHDRKTVNVWDVVANRRQVFAHKSEMIGLQWNPKGTHLASSPLNGIIRIWDIATGHFRVFKGHNAVINGIKWNSNGTHFASCSYPDSTVRVWNVKTGESQLLSQRTNSKIAWHPQGTHLASCAKSGVAILDLVKGCEIQTLYEEGKSRLELNNTFFQWNLEGTHLVCSSPMKRTVWIWNMLTNTTLRLPGFHGPCQWNPQGTHLALWGGNHEIHIWDIEASTFRILHGELALGGTILWNPLGTHIAVYLSVYQKVKIWDIETGSSIQGNHAKFEWAPSGTHYASCPTDRSIAVWKFISCVHIQEKLLHHDKYGHIISTIDNPVLPCSN